MSESGLKKEEVKKEEKEEKKEDEEVTDPHIDDAIEWGDLDTQMLKLSASRGYVVDLLAKWPIWRYYTDTKDGQSVMRVLGSMRDTKGDVVIRCLTLVPPDRVSSKEYRPSDIKVVDTWTKSQKEAITKHPVDSMWYVPMGHFVALGSGLINNLRDE
jgi:hypothetical protein